MDGHSGNAISDENDAVVESESVMVVVVLTILVLLIIDVMIAHRDK